MSEASKRGRQSSNSDDSPAAKKTAPSSTTKTTQLPVIPAKVFVVKHLFEHVSTLPEGGEITSEDWDDHFGLNWTVSVARTKNQLSVYMVEGSEKWCMEGDIRIDLCGRDAKNFSVIVRFDRGHFTNYGCEDMLSWDKLSEYTIDDRMKIQVEMRISFMSKIGSNEPSKFDSSKSEVSDCILVAQDQKFHVSRHFLATHSPYFKALLLGPYREAKMAEVHLPGLDPYDVENFLRVIYGYQAINDQNVEGLLLIADKNDTPIIKERCEKYLLEESEKSIGKTFDMFLKFHCNMDKIMDEITTLDEYKEVINGDFERYDLAVAKRLLMKSAELLLR
ncbi:unnamed protein product [Caenorhabditis brenneri]